MSRLPSPCKSSFFFRRLGINDASFYRYSTMYMQEVLEKACHKRKLDNPKEWALLSDDYKILVPLDRTVASLEGSSQLVLVQRSLLPHYGFAIDGDRRTARSIDPNG